MSTMSNICLSNRKRFIVLPNGDNYNNIITTVIKSPRPGLARSPLCIRRIWRNLMFNPTIIVIFIINVVIVLIVNYEIFYDFAPLSYAKLGAADSLVTARHSSGLSVSQWERGHERPNALGRMRR